MLKYRQIQIESNIVKINSKNSEFKASKNIPNAIIKQKLINSNKKENHIQKLNQSATINEKRIQKRTKPFINEEKKPKYNSQIKRNIKRNNIINIQKPLYLSAEKRKINNNINNESLKIKSFIKTKEIKPTLILTKKKDIINNNNHKIKENNKIKIRKMNMVTNNTEVNILNNIKSTYKKRNNNSFLKIKADLNNISFNNKNKISNIKKNIMKEIKEEENNLIKSKLILKNKIKKNNLYKSKIKKNKKSIHIKKDKEKLLESSNNKSTKSNGNNKATPKEDKKNNNNNNKGKDTINSNQTSSSIEDTITSNDSENSNKYDFKRNITYTSYKLKTEPSINTTSNNNQNEEVKILEFKPQNNQVIKNKKYLRRRSVDNPSVREKLENYMNKMMLKQNGGNTLFLTNYEIGSSYEKEICLLINQKKIKRKIKISSCTKAGCSGPGIVKENQDSYFIKDNFINNTSYIFLGVCDGHGEQGKDISNLVSNKLPNYITSLSTEEIISNFKKINEEIYTNPGINSNMSGTTVVSIIITQEKLICINLGDSRLTLFKYDNGIYYSKNLSREHKPIELDEYNRIILKGGVIKKCFDEKNKKFFGPERVWLKDKEEPGLAMTRSLGDKIAHNIGVSDEPEIKKFFYDGSEKFIVIASDGLWEYINSDYCIKIVKKFYEEKKEPKEAALELTKEAFKRWKRKEVVIDDITVIVIFFY